MKVQLMVQDLFCRIPTDNGLLNSRDEGYFVVGGIGPQGAINIPRVSPPPPEDYYGLTGGDHAYNIPIWSGDLNDGEAVKLFVLFRDQDNAQLQGIFDAIKGAIEAVVGYLTDNADLAKNGLDDLAKAGGELISSLSGDKHQTIGGFSAEIRVDCGQVYHHFGVLSFTQIAGTDAFHLLGSNADYLIWAGVAAPATLYAGSYRAGNDGYILQDSDQTDFPVYCNNFAQQGFLIRSMACHVESLRNRFVGIYEPGNEALDVQIDLDWNAFAAKRHENGLKGLKLVGFTPYLNLQRRFAAAFRPIKTGQTVIGPVDWTTFVKYWQSVSDLGFRLDIIRTWVDSGSRVFVGVFGTGQDAHYLWSGADWNGFLAKWKELNDAGLRLVDFTTYHEAGVTRYVGAFRSGSGRAALRPPMSWAAFGNDWDAQSKSGLRLRNIAAFAA